jgi:hypothetical protein
MLSVTLNDSASDRDIGIAVIRMGAYSMARPRHQLADQMSQAKHTPRKHAAKSSSCCSKVLLKMR